MQRELTVTEEPQITSPIREERILARRLRISKRNAAAKRRLQLIEDGKELPSDKEETVLEAQVEKSTVELLTLTEEGRELITNVRVAADAHEVKRRADQAVAKEARIKKLEEEADIAQKKFETINSKWEGIAVLNDPLDLHHETEMQREKCLDLITQKDQLIADLKDELKAGDARFLKDQQKQADDIALLVERIDSQITIMRRAYRRELILIEQAIDIERKETMDVNDKRWEALYKQREEDENSNLEQRFAALEEDNRLMQDILVHHQEKFRATKISLEKDIQILQQQLEQVKAICMLNKEKMEYNYQVLKKRDEESLLIRSQQKRRINKLQDIVTTLRRKIVAMDQSTQAEVKRLTSEVIKLHRNIKDIQVKAEHFCAVNETKYFQLWKFNHDSAQKLLDKILSTDRLIYEQQLGLTWQPVQYTPTKKEDLPSYKAAINKRDSYGQTVPDSWSTHIQDVDKERLLHRILEAVADKSGFLVEDRLNILLASYTHSQNTLVRIDNVFNALGVTRPEDMVLLMKTMEPYVVCVTCQPILQAIHPVSPPAQPPIPPLTEEEFMTRVMKKIVDCLEEGDKLTALKKDSKQSDSDDNHMLPEPLVISGRNTVTSDSIYASAPWITHPERLERSFLSIFPPTLLSHDIKSTATSFFTIAYSHHKSVHKITSNQTPKYSSDTVTSCLASEDPEPPEPLPHEELSWKKTHDPNHLLSINPVFVLKALREFVYKFRALKQRNKSFIWGKKTEEKKSISRQLSDSDVKTYWEQFRDALPPEREKLWDCLFLGLQRYHTVLQERHKINNEIEHLKLQNSELRRLLQRYALPNNMKPTKGPRQQLPPLLNVKTVSAPVAPTPNRLVLAFNNSSRL